MTASERLPSLRPWLAGLAAAGLLASAVPAQGQPEPPANTQPIETGLAGIGLTLDAFTAIGEQAEKASKLLPELRKNPAFSGMWFEGNVLMVGTTDANDAALVKAASELGATVKAVKFTDADVRATFEKVQQAVPSSPLINYDYSSPEEMVINVTAGSPPDIKDIPPNIRVNILLPEGTTGPTSALARTGLAGGARLQAPAGAVTAEDLQGGVKFFAEQEPGFNLFCSIAFPAVGPAGEPAFISAGHCAPAGNRTLLDKNGTLVPFGSYAVSVFTEADGVKADIGVVKTTDPGLLLKPAVKSFRPDGSPLLITGTAEPFVGAPVCKSGSNTGVTCGKITDLRRQDMRNGNYINGFGTDLRSNPGDSGGGSFIGMKAVGVQSGSTTDNGTGALISTNFSSLVPALPALQGYKVRTTADPTHPVLGDIRGRWEKSGGMGGLGDSLGPAEAAAPGAGGAARSTQRFARGVVYAVAGKGAFVVTGEIASLWQAAGGPEGTYGFPVSDATTVDGAPQQTFEGGTLKGTATAAPSPAASPAATSEDERSSGDSPWIPYALAGGGLAAAGAVTGTVLLRRRRAASHTESARRSARKA